MVTFRGLLSLPAKPQHTGTAAPASSPPPQKPATPVVVEAPAPPTPVATNETTTNPLLFAPGGSTCQEFSIKTAEPNRIGVYSKDKFAPGKIALTFDDGPHGNHTAKIMQILKDHGVKGTFFVNGLMINSTNYMLIGQMIAEGHIVANHTENHINNISTKSAEQIELELRWTQAMVTAALNAKSGKDFSRMKNQVDAYGEALTLSIQGDPAGKLKALKEKLKKEGITYVPVKTPEEFAALTEALFPAGAVRYEMKYMRPPGGNPYGPIYNSQRKKFDAVLEKLGLYNMLWTRASQDSDPSVSGANRKNEAVMGRSVTKFFTDTGALAASGGIILMHDRIPPGAVEIILDDLDKKKGTFEVVDMDTLMKMKYDCVPLDTPLADDTDPNS